MEFKVSGAEALQAAARGDLLPIHSFPAMFTLPHIIITCMIFIFAGPE